MTTKPRRLLGTSLAVGLLLALATAVVGSQVRNYVAPLSGGEEVPANASKGRGGGHLPAECGRHPAGLPNHRVQHRQRAMAHIHALAPAGLNTRGRGLAVPLDGPGPGLWAAAGMTGSSRTGRSRPRTWSALCRSAAAVLVDAIESGQAYVNVHTNDGMGEINTGIGDLQNGEIRGQLP